MNPKMFKSLRVGQKVRDTWYGAGVVLKKTARRATIRLYTKGETWEYDRLHVNHFIVKEGRTK